MTNNPNLIQTIEKKNRKLVFKKVSRDLFANMYYDNILNFFEVEYLTQSRIKESLCKKRDWSL